jgi:hypothetical protein
MKKLSLTLAAVAVSAAVFAQGTVVYNPTRSIKDQSISVRSWGSGSMAETDEVAFEGVYSIRVSTRNFFAGGQMQMSNPIDLASVYADKNNLIRFQLRMADGVTLGGGGGAGGGSRGGLAGGGAAGAAGDGGGEGRGQGGLMPGGGSPAGGSANYETTLRNLRVIFTTTDGKKSEVYVPVNTSRVGERNWLSVAVPVQAINGFDKTNKTISEIGIAGDAMTTFYIGEIRVVNDATPISGGVNNSSYNLALGDEVEFSGWGFGGSSVLKYSWDFDEADGIQDEVNGPMVRRRFRKPGDFTVTLTITDVYGLKKPYTTKIKVKVNP